VVVVTFWLIGEEEHADLRFTTNSLGLYTRAGSWCMAQVRYRPAAEIPVEWVVPAWVVKGWGSMRAANELVAQKIWEPVQGGWRFQWIRANNTADYVRRERKRQRTKKARQRQMSPGDITLCPMGTYTGDTESVAPQERKPCPDPNDSGAAS
jgi:hypothetical protein